MEKISTNFDLIRSLYNETTASENRTLNQDLAENAELRAEYNMLRDAKNALPSPTSLGPLSISALLATIFE
jgi:hypothetical protein